MRQKIVDSAPFHLGIRHHLQKEFLHFDDEWARRAALLQPEHITGKPMRCRIDAGIVVQVSTARLERDKAGMLIRHMPSHAA